MKTFNEFVANKENLLVENFADDACENLKNAAMKDLKTKNTNASNTLQAIEQIKKDFRIDPTFKSDKFDNLTNIAENLLKSFDWLHTKLIDFINNNKPIISNGGLHQARRVHANDNNLPEYTPSYQDSVDSINDWIEQRLRNQLYHYMKRAGGEPNKPSFIEKGINFATGNKGANTNPYHYRDK